ncbi:hypothetical protein ACFQH2_07745 [Natronoarchaeum sp. GCM10025703]|uniref:hypothetical protein n=1 Tax=Natronoarchaeum sp. GCM10025703 TaxID=3252685 RepID=UPI00361BD397
MNDDHTRLYATLATCFQHPDEAFVDAVRNGTLGTIVAECAASLPIDSVDAPPRFEDIARARREYLRTFRAFEGEYAPPPNPPTKSGGTAPNAASSRDRRRAT